MPNYIRADVSGGSYFFTVALAQRSGSLLVDHIDALRLAFRKEQKASGFRVDAMVVLPDHLHCIWTLPPGDADFPAAGNASRLRFRRACQTPSAFPKVANQKASAAFGNAGIGSI